MNGVLLLVILLAFGTGCAMIAKSKNRSPMGFFVLGLLLGLIGLLITACMSKKQSVLTSHSAPMATNAGWFPDPYGSVAGTLRWFDGSQWGSQTKAAV
jgi:uncharacterized protein DUF2510